MREARGTSLPLVTGACWGLAPWVADHGLLVFAAAVGFGLLRDHPLRAGLAALLGTAIQLAALPSAWRDGVGDGAWPVTIALVAVQTLPPALAGLLAARSAGPSAWALGLAWTAVAGLMDAMMLPVGHALLVADDTHVWLWPAAIGGPALLTGLIAAWGAWAVDRPRPAGAALLVWGALGLVLPNLDHGPTLRLGIVQPDIDPLSARAPSLAPAVVARVRGLLDRVHDADLVVAPEGAWPTDPGDAPGARRTAFLRELGPRGPVVLGANVGSERPRTNSLLAVDGQVVDRVDKRLLVPVWERRFLGLGSDLYRAGHGPPVLQVAGLTLGALICYEDLFPRHVRAASGTDLLLAATHDGWNGPGAGSRLHLAASRLAAATTGLWTARPALNGPSAVFDRWGRTVWSAPFTQGELSDTVGVAAIVEVRLGWGGRPGPWLHPVVSALAAAILLGRRR